MHFRVMSLTFFNKVKQLKLSNFLADCPLLYTNIRAQNLRAITRTISKPYLNERRLEAIKMENSILTKANYKVHH